MGIVEITMEVTSYPEIGSLLLTGFKDWSRLGEVNVTYKGNLALFNYTNKAQIMGRWNFLERVSRGLIFDISNGEVVAKPFRKFFNAGEEMPWPQATLIEATEKKDGSLGIIYHYQDDWHVATRGSFDSEQAAWAEQELHSGKYNLSNDDIEMTYLCEIIYPENRVVVNYGDRRELCLIGGIYNKLSVDMYWSQLEAVAERVGGFTLPKRYTMTEISDYLNLAVDLSANEEGWVLRYNDGTRYKVKGDAYKAAHKVMTGVNKRRVCEAMRTGVLDTLLAGVPDEFLKDIRGYQAEILEEVNQRVLEIHDAFARVEEPMGNRKDFAVRVMKSYRPLQGYMFALYDGRPIEDMIYKELIEGMKINDQT